ncbi:MAG: gamma carbonic anhydrase family protein, partial [Actinomycetota bacterium]
ESGATVGANAVVGNRKRIPAGSLAVGVPAIIKEGASSREVIEYSAQSYVDNGRRFTKEMRQID